MRKKHVIVLPYDKSWKLNFERIMEELLKKLGDTVLGIEHIGSTSVEGLSTKPMSVLKIRTANYYELGD